MEAKQHPFMAGEKDLDGISLSVFELMATMNEDESP